MSFQRILLFALWRSLSARRRKYSLAPFVFLLICFVLLLTQLVKHCLDSFDCRLITEQAIQRETLVTVLHALFEVGLYFELCQHSAFIVQRCKAQAFLPLSSRLFIGTEFQLRGIFQECNVTVAKGEEL